MEDHPRSRGVYVADEVVGPGEVGSSPLARGLLLIRGLGGVHNRIIPARAGFTTYFRRNRINVRIIPARAGFTRIRESGLADA